MTKDITAGDSLRNAFGKSLVKLADNHDFTVFDCDVAGGTGLTSFRDEYPDRFYNVGIAEQAGVGAAAGYALASKRKAIISTFGVFGARAWEMFRLSVAYNKADVILVLSHLGLDVGPDGASAQSLEHIPLWTGLPGVTVIQPATPREMGQAVECLLSNTGPAVLFTGRSEVDFELPDSYRFECGAMQAVKKTQYVQGNRYKTVALIATGQTVGVAMRAATILDGGDMRVTVYNASTLAPFMINSQLLVAKTDLVVTIEDHGENGLYSLVAQDLASSAHRPPVKSIRVAGWGESGEAKELYGRRGLSPEMVAARVRGWAG